MLSGIARRRLPKKGFSVAPRLLEKRQEKDPRRFGFRTESMRVGGQKM